MSVPAARLGDSTVSGDTIAVGAAPTVWIAGRPVSTAGDAVSGPACVGVVVAGSRTVIVGGRPLVRAGDLATGVQPTSGSPVTTTVVAGQTTVVAG
jgi:uncharacterized Zn-binding protein involved in type VI secretion